VTDPVQPLFNSQPSMTASTQPAANPSSRFTSWPAGPRGRWAAFAWGAAEASFFFLVPDILLSLVALTAPRRVWGYLAAAMAGALLVGALMFQWSASTPLARAFVAEVPRVSATMFERADADLRSHGALGAIFGPARGIPYKVYAVQAPSHAITLGAFVTASVPARLWRMLATVAVFAVIGLALRKFGKSSWALTLHAIFWVTSVTAYWLSIG
jgi:hypothetical protein